MAQFWIKDEDFASLKDKVVVLTGGASGIGLATTQLLLDTGAKVVMGDQNDPPLTHDNLTFQKTDVTSWDSLKALFKTAVEKHTRIDHVFANAGIGPRNNYLEDIYDASGELQEPGTLVYDINLRGCINTAYLGIHYFQKQSPQTGSIVCTASASSFQQFGAWDYTTAKHGVLGWMRAAVPNFIEKKLPIRVNSIGPSWTLTGLVPSVLSQIPGIETQTPDVVARQVAVLFADESRQGQFIYSSAGRHYEIEHALMLENAKVINALGKSEGTKKSEQEAYKKLQEDGTLEKIQQSVDIKSKEDAAGKA